MVRKARWLRWLWVPIPTLARHALGRDAHCTLTALARLGANLTEAVRQAPDGHGRSAVWTRFRPKLHRVEHQLEGLFLPQALTLPKGLPCLLDGPAKNRPLHRPQRSYPRRSRLPETNWRNRQATTAAS